MNLKSLEITAPIRPSGDELFAAAENATRKLLASSGSPPERIGLAISRTSEAVESLFSGQAEKGAKFLVDPPPGSASKFTQLSNGTFATIFTEGRLRFPRPDLGANMHAEARLAPSDFTRLDDAFARFILPYKDARRGIDPTARLAQASAVFKEQVVPALNDAGVRVEDVLDLKQAHLFRATEFRLNSEFALKGGDRVDLNSGSGFGAMMNELSDGRLADTIRDAVETPGTMLFRSVFENDRSRVAANLYRIAGTNSELHPLLDPGSVRGSELVVPMSFGLKVPIHARSNAIADLQPHVEGQFEEIAHFFQETNQQPITAMGLRLENAARNGDPIYKVPDRHSADVKDKIIKQLIKEQELLGVYRELGFAPTPEFFGKYRRLQSLSYLRPPESSG